MSTMKEHLNNLRESQPYLSEGEIFEIACFVDDILPRLYSEQIITNPLLDVFAVALEYDSEVEYYQILQWDIEMQSFLNKGESTVPRKLLGFIFQFAAIEGIKPLHEDELSKDEAKKLGIILKDEESDEQEKRYGRKRKKKTEEKRERWYLLLNLGEESVAQTETKEPQKETG